MTDAGKKVKQARKLSGLTQRELADHSGVSVSTIRKLEQGERNGARMETLRALALVLRVPTMSLVAEPSEDGPTPGTQEVWSPVREALTRPLAVDSEEAPTLEGVADSVAAAIPLYRAHRFGELATVLPHLICDSEALGSEGRAERLRVLQLTAGALTHTRQFDMAETVLRRALDDATDRMVTAATINTLCWLLMRQGRLDEALRTAVHWADELEPRISRATPAELSAWGLLLLNVSAAAIRNNQPGAATDALKFAASAATALGRETRPEHEQMRTFGPISVRMKTVEDALVRDQPDRALRLAASLSKTPRSTTVPSASVRARHGLDVASAYARLGQFTEAFGKLAEIQVASPEWFPNQSPARDVLRTVVAGRRTLTPEMRSMAQTLQLVV
ncbi:helix-turn-helix domain-containing protein [Streptomyces sp. NBC_01433]|uniref:helix-turn-helix domain-containing protein n=1 Tax=Streptomyces sp. NBC_01433 TaxID=2903864 RepID=UPI00225AC467|nr:helix-turn-helix transcriptional regulator [Streptomyces sp. NBC_01433]MCX4677543.1 helix-turn-helix domain-containing protein [Streptomyces sp. NBC_01433]